MPTQENGHYGQAQTQSYPAFGSTYDPRAQASTYAQAPRAHAGTVYAQAPSSSYQQRPAPEYIHQGTTRAPMRNTIAHQNYAPLPGVASTQKKRPAYLAPRNDLAEAPRYARAGTAAEYAPRHAVAAREYVPQAAAPITEYVPYRPQQVAPATPPRQSPRRGRSLGGKKIPAYLRPKASQSPERSPTKDDIGQPLDKEEQLKIKQARQLELQRQKDKQALLDRQLLKERTRSASQQKSGARGFFSSVFSGFDKQDKSKVFINGKLNLNSQNGQKYLKDSFDLFDKNHDNRLDISEIYACMNKMNKKVSYGQILRLMREFDEDHDGTIDFKEYTKMVRALQDGNYDDYDSDDEIELYNDKIVEREESPSKKLVPVIPSSIKKENQIQDDIKKAQIAKEEKEIKIAKDKIAKEKNDINKIAKEQNGKKVPAYIKDAPVAPKPEVKPIVKETPKPIVKPVVKPIVKETPKPIAKPIVKETPKPIAKPIVKPPISKSPSKVTPASTVKKPAVANNVQRAQSKKKGKKLKSGFPGDLSDDEFSPRRQEIQRVQERNRFLEQSNRELKSQSNQGDNEQRLYQELMEHQQREREMLAQIESLRRQNVSMNGHPAPQPQVLRSSFNPQSNIQLRQTQVPQQQPNGQRQFTRNEAKQAARNAIVNKITKEQLTDENYCKYLDDRFDYSFNKLRGPDDRVSEHHVGQITNDMLNL